MHLFGAILGGLLASFQFIPIIRYKFMLFHRINGYISMLLFLVGNAGAFMIIRRSVGGEISAQTATGTLGVLTTTSLVLAYINIKRLQIDQHRAWMLRAWTIAASIASQRLIQRAMLHVISTYKYNFSLAIICRELHYIYAHVGVPDAGNPIPKLYPACAVNGQDPITSTTWVAVPVLGTGVENIAASLRWSFGPATWIALLIHLVAIELYLWLTPAEGYRLRQVSAKRQIEAGMREPEAEKDAGFTASRLGDAPPWWSMPPESKQNTEYYPLNPSGSDLSHTGQMR